MDKEAQEKIIASVLLEETMRSEVAADMVALKVRQRLEAYGFGYRKLPEGKPPLLGRREIFSNQEIEAGIASFDATLRIAQAQRDSDIKWMK